MPRLKRDKGMLSILPFPGDLMKDGFKQRSVEEFLKSSPCMFFIELPFSPPQESSTSVRVLMRCVAGCGTASKPGALTCCPVPLTFITAKKCNKTVLIC